jgi:hypothetical protein
MKRITLTFVIPEGIVTVTGSPRSTVVLEAVLVVELLLLPRYCHAGFAVPTVKAGPRIVLKAASFAHRRFHFVVVGCSPAVKVAAV